MKRSSASLTTLVVAAILLSSCSGLPPLLPTGYPRETPAAGAAFSSSRGLSQIQELLLEGALSIQGEKAIELQGRSFFADCIGTVQGIYHYAGLDLARDFGRYNGNGVFRLYRSLEDRGLLYDTNRPEPGELIFWDDTWDRNGDGKWNDPLTHVGMVTGVDERGTIDYVHYHYKKGVVIEKMNLSRPDVYRSETGGRTTILNSPMRMREAGRPRPAKWLSSHLYRCFSKLPLP
jgi:hypothetical protein